MPIIRNKALVEALSYMRYIEEWGSGLRRVNRVLAEYGIRPVAIDEAAFATQMNVNHITAPGREGNEGNREGNEGNREGNATERVLAALKRNPKASIIALSKELGISHATIERTEKALQTTGPYPP